MSHLRVTLVQTDVFWENPSANRAQLEELLHSNRNATDLIILPEMFTTGFTMHAASLAEVHNLDTFKWMKQMAALFSCAIVGSYIVKENEKFYNRCILVHPSGSYDTYDKRHLFRMGGEDAIYTAGTERKIWTIKDWSIAPFICYDLRFPVWSRNHPTQYDLILYIASWPSKRASVWKTLLAARAIENAAYVIGVNRVGEDGNHLTYAGDSQVIQFDGTVLYDLKNDIQVVTITLDKEPLSQYRSAFPVHLDADDFKLLL